MQGGFGEGASYNLIPRNWSREFATTFPTTPINSTIDVNKILKDLIAIEQANGADIVDRQDGSSYVADLLTEDWGLHVMEWTVTGQSGDYIHDPAFPNDFSKKVYVPNSKGRFTFDDYYIPNPCCSNPTINCDSQLTDSCADTDDCVLSQQVDQTNITSTHFEAIETIKSDAVINNGMTVTFSAGSEIELQANFEVMSIDLALTPQLTEVDPPEKNGVIKIKKRSLRTFS